ncbi:class I SAM-dependent methyltransferase [Halobacterium jilantaiense]|uniref:Methyltransferase domain-containing protein n=1 Tax=Halobacterium jilantaiense TaxID=355548 RepID=A0A1I0N8F1_9EURY|nr:class I SAM-dependent methyltransferase [Halobacterium jilantaiense]SEV97378.1 Methyltransferase domain-containing protein [Halobacterium jilantaiense]
MGFHTFDADRAAKLEDPDRFRFCSREELLAGLDPNPDDRIADLGSGTGFYTRELAPLVDTVEAVDVQAEMHELLREYGRPANVSQVTADVADLPFAADALDGAASTMTFHEFATPDSLAELHRVLEPGARLVVADWTATGSGEDGPPVAERYDAADAESLLADAGFTVREAADRLETLFVVAEA